jgi:tRNA G18 (ribose-2'-O)-methylase SpoU
VGRIEGEWVDKGVCLLRGYFAVGVEGISKPMNLGNLFRSAHAFGASFVFTINADRRAFNMPSDTSRGAAHLPSFSFSSVSDLKLPKGCRLVGVELLEDAVELPSFYHPQQAAYVLGPERGGLSAELIARCDHLVKIPTKFCINVAIAGAILMYDRSLVFGRFAERPLHEGSDPQELPEHKFGDVLRRRPAPSDFSSGE